MQNSELAQNIDLKIDKLDVKDVILGHTKIKAHWTLLNHIIMVGKQTIYSNRSRRTNPTLLQVIDKLINILSISNIPLQTEMTDLNFTIKNGKFSITSSIIPK